MHQKEERADQDAQGHENGENAKITGFPILRIGL